MDARRVRAALLIGAGFVTGAVSTVLVMVLLVLPGAQSESPAAASGYKEAEHRVAAERRAGHPMADWPKHQAAVQMMCDYEAEAFTAEIRTLLAQPTPDLYDLMRIGVQYRCPSRLVEFDRAAAWVRANR